MQNYCCVPSPPCSGLVCGLSSRQHYTCFPPPAGQPPPLAGPWGGGGTCESRTRPQHRTSSPPRPGRDKRGLVFSRGCFPIKPAITPHHSPISV